jgi:hypothetical protein
MGIKFNSTYKLERKEDLFYFHKNNCSRPVFRIFTQLQIKDMFAKAVVYEIETNFKELQWKLDYVRLNIHAKK